MYQDSRNIKTTCKKCPDMQTTSVSGSTSGSDCICKKGFWDPIRKTRQPARNQECQGMPYTKLILIKGLSRKDHMMNTELTLNYSSKG